jgi:ribonucleoside-diphosphate reductase alpha chain
MELNQWLESELQQNIWTKKYCYNNETLDEFFDRVSGGNEDIKKLIIEKKFLFGGRTLSNRNTHKQASYSNCYSAGYAPDSVEGIMDLCTKLALTYKSQGGQGLSLSKIRPKGTGIKNGIFESDGIIPFMELFNQVTASIAQGNSRKGALMMSLDCWHKEIFDFINIKSQLNSITKANLSVEIDNEFMNAVEEYYFHDKILKKSITQTYEGNEITYEITPIDVFNAIIERAYDWAEPGVLFVNQFRNYNLMEYDNEYEIITSNPCGEQPLAKNSACNLASMNLSEYVINPYTESAQFEFLKFKQDVMTCIIAMDKIVDEGKYLHALKSQQQMSENYRNIGLGIMGVGEMLVKLNITYGSHNAIELLDEILTYMFRMAVFTSNKLAFEHGTFPKYSDEIFNSEIIWNHFNSEEIEQLRIHGLRNCSLLSIAPTGTIGTMLNVSGGIEPIYAIKYTRKTESLHKDQHQFYDVYCKSAEEYLTLYPFNKLPECFVGAEDIPWENRIFMQSTAQSHIDTAISSTINLPHNTSIKEIGELYLLAWQKKLKGVTVYRSGCKREGILTTTTNHNKNIQSNRNYIIPELPRGFIEEVPKDLSYRKYKLRSGCGNLYFFVGVDEFENKIYDCFTNTDGLGGCTVNTIANSRLMSAALRGGIPIEYLVQQLEKSGSCASYQNVRGRQIGALKIKNMMVDNVDQTILQKIDEYIGKPLSNGKSCASAIGQVLKNIIQEFDGEEYEDIQYEKIEKNEILKNEYTECKHENIKMVEGCVVCPDCGYSKCN